MSDNLKFEEKKMTLGIHLGSLQQLTVAKSGILPIISSISAAVLVIATFNQNLIPITFGVKLCLIVLLLLIPISLFFFLIEMSFAIKKTIEAIQKVVEIEIKLPEKNYIEKIIKWFLFYTPFILSTILTIVIFYFIFLIISPNSKQLSENKFVKTIDRETRVPTSTETIKSKI